MEVITLNWTQFTDKYEPVRNTFVRDAACDGFLFEDRDMIKDIPRIRTWSLIDDNDGTDMYITNGHRMINSLGYLVTKNEWNSEETIEIRLDETDGEVKQ